MTYFVVISCKGLLSCIEVMDEIGALSTKLRFFSIGLYVAACHITKVFEQLDPVPVEITVMPHV